MASFGRFFSGMKGKKKADDKQKVSKTKSADAAVSIDDDSDGDSYEDPSQTFATEPPIPSMPNYPPPRLNSMNAVIMKKRDDYIEPYDSKLSGPISPAVHSENTINNYADPFDSKFVHERGNSFNNNKEVEQEDEYDEPYECSKQYKKSNDNDNYSSPWDSNNHSAGTGATDNYSAPWDMAKSISNNKKSSVRNITNRHDEYSDPWDAKNSSSPKSQDASFDDTYSEPYDKGKSTIMDEKKRIHETLVEDEIEFSDKEKRWMGVNVSKDDNKVNSPDNQSSSIPPPTQPRADDYDAPWDWKVKKIENDFEKAFKVESHTIPTPEIKTTEGSSEPSSKCDPVVKQDEADDTTGSSINENNDLSEKNYQVDPTIPLQNQGWFHGRIRRFEAEELLKSDPDCSYLIRNSESSKLDYSLSIRNNGATIHLKISYRDNKYILGMNSRPFDTIPEMIHHYSMNKLNIRGAEQVKLQYPVLQEAVYFTVMPGS